MWIRSPKYSMGKLFYTRRNKFSYKPSPDGKGLDEENLKNFIGIGIPFTFKNTPFIASHFL